MIILKKGCSPVYTSLKSKLKLGPEPESELGEILEDSTP